MSRIFPLLIAGAFAVTCHSTKAQDATSAIPGTAHIYNGGKLANGPPSNFPPLPGLPSGGQGGTIPAPLLNSTEAAIDQESHGEFPSMARGPSLPLGTLQRSWDRPVAASGQTAPGVIHYLWQSDFVMGVRTRDFMVTTVILPTWEKIAEYYVGDPVVFEIKKIRGNVFAIRSRNAGADSNLALLGSSGNIYNFYVRSEAWNSGQVSDLTVYVDAPRDNEDEDIPSASEATGRTPLSSVVPDYVRKIVRRPEDIRFDMKLYAQHPSDADIAPLRVFEDGLFTYFDYGDRADTVTRPVIHQVVDGVDSVVNSRTVGPHGSILVAEAVGDFTLRNGNRVVCAKRAPSKSFEDGGG